MIVLIVSNHIGWHSYLSKWRIQNGKPSKCKNLLAQDENLYLGVIEVADYESTENFKIENGGFNVAGSICKNLLFSSENWYSEPFEVADYESWLKILYIEIMDPIWWIKMSTFAWLRWKFLIGVFRSLRISSHNFEIKNSASIMADQYAKIILTRIFWGTNS